MFFGRYHIRAEYQDGIKDPSCDTSLSWSQAKEAVRELLDIHRACGNKIERINSKSYKVLIGQFVWGTITISKVSS